MLANSCKELCNLVSILIYIVWLDVQNILEKYYHLSWHCYYDYFFFFVFSPLVLQVKKQAQRS